MSPNGTTRRRVGVNLLWLVPGVVGGSEESTVRLLHGLADLAPPDLELRLFVLDALAAAHPELVERFPVDALRLRGRLKPLRVAAEQTWLAVRARRRGVDLIHHVGGTVPLVNPAPTILTIHDLQPLDRPENFHPAKVAYLRATLPRSVRAAAVVVTPSTFTSRGVVERFGADPARVRTVHHGVDPAMLAPVPADEVARVRREYRLAGPWLIYPVITYPHKNHGVLVGAFAELARRHPDLHLVLPGRAGPAEPAVAAAVAASGAADRIRRLGRVAPADLRALLAGAVVMPFPSRYEGFGVGALEAMAQGVPVVASTAGALPEVVGRAAPLVDPDDGPGWVAALDALVADAALRRARSEAGRARAALFGQERGARDQAAAYRAALGDADSETPTVAL